MYGFGIKQTHWEPDIWPVFTYLFLQQIFIAYVVYRYSVKGRWNMFQLHFSPQTSEAWYCLRAFALAHTTAWDTFPQDTFMTNSLIIFEVSQMSASQWSLSWPTYLKSHTLFFLAHLILFFWHGRRNLDSVVREISLKRQQKQDK